MRNELIILLDNTNANQRPEWLQALPEPVVIRYLDCRKTVAITRSLQAEWFSDEVQYLVIDSASNLSSQEMHKILSELEKTTEDDSSRVYMRNEGDFAPKWMMAPNQLAPILKDGAITSIQAITTDNKTIQMMSSLESPTSKLFMTGLGMAASSVERQPQVITLPSTQSVKSPTEPAKAERAALLRFLLNIAPIERIFPEHEWNDFPQESAAACYQRLAAMFLHLEDFQAVQDCLTYSDQFEDSPRSLALKGYLAFQQGEPLAAVANLVSSLQEYEKRKLDDKPRYVTFAPQNLDLINERLNAGLNALNERDNCTAFKYFSEAVWNFDSFFENAGMEQPH